MVFLNAADQLGEEEFWPAGELRAERDYLYKLMLAKKYRLPIQTVIGESGQSKKSRCFLLKIFSNKLSFDRFGVVISKKIVKKATERNEIKRLIFNNLRVLIKENSKSKNSKDFLIIVLKNVLELEKKDVVDDLKKLIGV